MVQEWGTNANSRDTSKPNQTKRRGSWAPSLLQNRFPQDTEVTEVPTTLNGSARIRQVPTRQTPWGLLAVTAQAAPKVPFLRHWLFWRKNVFSLVFSHLLLRETGQSQHFGLSHCNLIREKQTALIKPKRSFVFESYWNIWINLAQSRELTGPACTFWARRKAATA